jgi:FAD/FMN-containing dehydrogenase
VVNALTAALRQAGLDADDSSLARSLYASDASLYRIAPQVVVRPRDGDDVLAVLAVAREQGVPVTMRGAGTSIAGNAIGPGIVIDTQRHLNQLVSIDPDARTATVQPGIVHAALQVEAISHGLRFGPDPAPRTTWNGSRWRSPTAAPRSSVRAWNRSTRP